MALDKRQFIDSLLEAYESFFDIKRDIEKDNISLAAEAIFHSRSEKYVLVKSAKLWAVETNEYAYFIDKETSSLEEFKNLREKVLEMGMKEIKPHSEHMYSYITMVYIANNIGDDIKKDIEQYKCHKMFLFSLHGWMYFRLAAVDLSKKTIITNKRGGELRDILQKVMQRVVYIEREADL
ncbi:hypothetical protein SDC9_166724 [bioreactor metagenome]|uniref:DUF8052 domain-containing protein n=1 Tax=bioreactor metagenome TaxID=1076179 RepID=A0A645FZL2_9ZZZZ|nr:hypothetical protein [Candidatus Metalachnospira sp.]